MKIAIFGTGMVGQTLAVALAGKGHSVTIGTRDVEKSLATTAPNAFGMPAFGTWHKANSKIEVATFADAAARGELIINATTGFSILEILKSIPNAAVNNKVMIDAANALDFSKGMPPRVSITDTAGASIGERLQNAYPTLRVVKALNTITAFAMLNPSIVPGDSTLFICGNDAAAKAEVTALLQSYGWKDVLDLGDISSSAATELMMPVWLKIWGKLGANTVFNYKIVR
jgi:8-hydroxy-5-deazaflavin:NADPH oxidoreductase